MSEGVLSAFGGLSQFKQRCNIKFMCGLEKNVAETLQGLEQVYRDAALKKRLPVSGTVGSEMDRKELRTSLAMGDLPCP